MTPHDHQCELEGRFVFHFPVERRCVGDLYEAIWDVCEALSFHGVNDGRFAYLFLTDTEIILFFRDQDDAVIAMLLIGG